MKKYINFLIVVFIITACSKSKNELKVFEHIPKTNGGEIFGNPKVGFFTNSKKDIFLDQDFSSKEKLNFINELSNIKTVLINSANSYDSKSLLSIEGDILDGYYTHAFIFNQDTIYAGPGMSCWLYIDKNEYLKTECYESEILKNRFGS